MRAKVKEQGLTGRKYMKELKRINLTAARALGERFHEVNLPRRFTQSGARMLGYAVRSARYNKRKRRLLRHADPLVYSGETKQNVLRTEDVREGGSSKTWRVSVILHARQLNRYKTRRGLRPADEIRRTATKEHGPLTRYFEEIHNAETDKLDR